LVGRRCASRSRSPARSPRSPWLLGQTPRSGDERMLDAATQDDWAQNGWLWLRGFLGAAEVEDLRRWTDEIAGWPEVPGRWMRYYERREGNPGARMLARIENFVPYHAGRAARVAGPPLGGLVRALSPAHRLPSPASHNTKP